MPADDQPRTLCERFQRSVHENGPHLAHRWKDLDEGVWRQRTYAQMGQMVEEATLGLVTLEVETGDRVGIIGHNSPEWAIVDWGILHAGAVTVPVYPQLKPDQIAYILDDAGVETVFVGDQELYDKAQAAAKDVDGLSTIVRMDDGELVPEEGTGNVDAVYKLQELLNEGQQILGRGDGEEIFAERWASVGPDDLATFIYTSGTTGRPKGVMLTHGNINENIASFTSVIDLVEHDRFLSFLPLSHSYERTVGHFATYGEGLEVWYAEDIDTIAEDMLDCRPELMIAVPRLWEKMGQKFEAALEEAEGLQRSLIDWARGVGEDVLDYRMEHGEEPGGLLGFKHSIAEELVLKKIRARAGLDELRMANSGAAALDPEVARFFWSLGVEIYEGYGLTETAPVLTANRPDAFKLGTVGKAIPGVELEIDSENWDGPPWEGEILAKGPNVMQGYWQLEEETEQTLDDGWLHTGDVGEIDEDGFLTITDRKKELFKTAYGKYVAPGHVAQEIKRAGDIVDQVLVVGESRKYVTALITPDFEVLEAKAKEEDISFTDRQDLVVNDRVQAMFDSVIEEANDELARHEQIKKYQVLEEEWSVGEEMTPTLKIKRRVVEDKYGDVIEGLYPDED